MHINILETLDFRVVMINQQHLNHNNLIMNFVGNHLHNHFKHKLNHVVLKQIVVVIVNLCVKYMKKNNQVEKNYLMLLVQFEFFLYYHIIILFSK